MRKKFRPGICGIYLELSQKLLQRTENVDISERLFQMDSVETVDLVSQNDEITS